MSTFRPFKPAGIQIYQQVSWDAMVMGISTKIWLVDMYCIPTILWMLLLFFDSSGTKHSFYASVIPAYDLDS
jgi:hypothetical protein